MSAAHGGSSGKGVVGGLIGLAVAIGLFIAACFIGSTVDPNAVCFDTGTFLLSLALILISFAVAVVSLVAISVNRPKKHKKSGHGHH